MELVFLFVQVDQPHQYVGDELRDDDLWDERASLALLRSLESFLDRNYGLNAATVHELHY